LNGIWSAIGLPLDAEGEAGYKMLTQGAHEVLAAQVPGEIHLDLIRAGRMEDPNISDNARTRCRWPERHSWWYRTEFTVPEGFRDQVRQQLIFDGIDLFGQIFVNGKLIGSTENAFASTRFNVKHLLRDGRNELVVRVTSGMELIPPRTLDGPQKIFDGDSEQRVYFVRFWDWKRSLRKPDYAAYGHDWCDPLPNIGIWQDVRLEGRSQVIIQEVRLDTAIRGKEVSLEGEVAIENLHPWSEIPVVIEVQLQPAKGLEVVQRFGLGAQAGRQTIPCRIVVPNPELWWPNDMGAQPLYQVTTRVICEEKETDRHVQTVGLRIIELDRSSLVNGSRFCFLVNGQRVFCKGGNWAPADLIPARIDAKRYGKLISEAKNAHFNMLRVNGVGLYESDEFYDACDRAGILVWQDFTFSDGRYPDWDEAYLSAVREEAETAVKRLRHHPSLAIWCGNSENQDCMARIWNSNSKEPEAIGGVRIYNEALPEVCRRYDPARPYWPSSPWGGIEPNSEAAGDYHGLYLNGLMGSDIKRDQRQQVIDSCKARFLSEYGVMGPPSMASIREYLNPGELSTESISWKIHSNATEVGSIAEDVRYYYGGTEKLSVSQFVLYGQMSQAVMQGAVIEAMRFRKDDPKDECHGVLVWSYNDCWGEVGWSIIDHYIRRKAGYYWFRRAATPVKVLVRTRGTDLVTRIVNDTRNNYRALVQYGWMRIDGHAVELKKHSINIPADGMVEVARVHVPTPKERDPKVWLYAAMLTGEGFPDDQAIWTLTPHRELALPKPVISTTIQSNVLKVSSPVYCHGVHVEDDDEEVLVDNFFDLLPGVVRSIAIAKPRSSGKYPLKAVMPLT
jgi:beta-mannosidase